MNSPKLKFIAELVCRIYVFVFLNIYGLGKIFGGQFYTPGRIPAEVAATPLGKAEAFDLAWTFMGHSHIYIFFVGASQVIGAWLLLANKTKLLGTLILIPVLLNVIVFDIVFLDKYGALASATIYFIMLVLILFLNKQRVISALQALTASPINDRSNKISLVTIVFGSLVFGLIFLVDQLLVSYFGHGKG